jgi:hypothetical protein
MTQKIMAQVRSKAESRKRIWQKLFFPLHVKLPLEAVTVMFCVVLGYYVYQSIEPIMNLTEAPVQDEHRVVVRQAPAPSAQPAEAPALQRQAETAAPHKAIEPAEAARDVRPRAMPGTDAAGGLADTIAVVEAPISLLTLMVNNIEKASAQIRDEIGRLGGTVVKTESVTNRIVISATIPPPRMEAFINYLDKLGRIHDKNLPPFRANAPASVGITITSEASGP